MLCDIKVGLSCNNACVHCIMEPVKQAQQRLGAQIDADTANIKALIGRAAARGFSHITLTGGEVTIRPDLPELVLFALDQGLHVVVQTNGRQLARPQRRDFLRAVPDPERIEFVIALHGPNALIHEAVTRRSGSFKQTCQAIEGLRGEGFQVCGKLVISRVNQSLILETLQQLKRLDVDASVVAFPHAEDFSSPIFHQVVPRYATVVNTLQAVLTSETELPATISYETIPYCILSHIRFWRSNLDLVFLKERIQQSETLIEMSMTGDTINWNVARGQIKSKPAACINCLLDSLCEGPWVEYVRYFGEEEFQPVTDRAMVNQFIESI